MTGGCMSRWPRPRKPAAPLPTTSAAAFAEASRPWTPPPGNRSGRPTRSPKKPRPTKKNAIGTQLWGPSGAGVWSSPAIDVRRNALYATTGDNYSAPASNMSDSFVAMDLDTGRILWSRQMTTGDAWNTACRLPDKTNCPDVNAPDFDFCVSAHPGDAFERPARARRRTEIRTSSTPSIPTIRARSSGRNASAAAARSAACSGARPPIRPTSTWRCPTSSGRRFRTASAPTRTRSQAAVCLPFVSTPANACGRRRRRSAANGRAAARRSRRRSARFPASCFRDRLTAICAPTPPPTARFSGTSTASVRTRPSTTCPPEAARSTAPVRRSPAECSFVSSGYARAGGMPGNVLLAFSVDGK